MKLKNVYLILWLLITFCGAVLAQSTLGTIQGTVSDNSGAVVPNAQVTATQVETNTSRSTTTDQTGNYLLPAMPPGTYSIEVKASGMAVQKIPRLVLDVSRTLVQNFQLQVGNVSQEVTVTAETPVIESGTITVGGTVDNRTVQEIPLNGRHFVDLASLVPGTVVPPVQNAFLTVPLRGQGAFAIVTAGQREDTTNFMINGINLNDMANGQITFQPSINTVSEFKIDNSTPSADHGRSSGSVVNIATRSGTNAFHGEAFDFLRNEAFDARNFFNKNFATSGANVGVPQPCNRLDPKQQGFCENSFKRNQFGAAIGGPIWKNHTFFFASYEGLRNRQGLALTASVPSAQQRAKVVDPAVKKLLTLVPTPDGGGPDPTKASDAVTLNSAASAPVDIDQGTIDIGHNIGNSDRLHGYYVYQRDLRLEPNNSGATIPGGGDQRGSRRQIFTFNETHIFSPAVVNDFRLGMNRIHITFNSDSQLRGDDPSQFGINNGITGPFGLPHINVGGIGLQFGGEGGFPQARGDYTAVLSENVNWLRGNHSFKFGGEIRRFNGNSIGADPGTVGFNNIGDFLGCTTATTCGTAKVATYSINGGGTHPARVFYNAFGLYGMDSWKLKPYLTVELGFRWEDIMPPTEAVNRSSLFNPGKDWLVQVGTNGFSQPYGANNKLFEPRVGLSWDMFHDGKTVLRTGYGILSDQLLPGPFVGAGNFPFGIPTQFTSANNKFSSFGTLQTDAAGGLTATGVMPNFKMPNVQTYNLNLQQEIRPTLGIMIGYFGSKSTHLEEDININQINNQSAGTRPFAKLAADSPIAPGKGLGNINYRSSVGNANYNALWFTGTKRMSAGLQFSANYTWSKSLDYNSRNFLGSTFQNATNLRGDYGPSDFDARHHFVVSGIYDLPFKGNRLVSGYRFSGDMTLQSGNPLNIGANAGSITQLTGNGNLRPDLLAALPSPNLTLITSGSNAGRVQWFPGASLVCDPRTVGSCNGAVFAIPVSGTTAAPIFHFGSMGRNAYIGPGFKNVDFSLAKTTKITERLSHEIRVEVFDVFNHPNFSNPGTTAQVGSSTFGVISATRAPTGDAGSSRQIQFAMKLIF